MELVQVMLGLIAIVCFYEYKHLSRNNIRHDELWFLYAGFVLVILLILTFFYHDTPPTNEIY